jgi:hypothetical protein
VQVLGAKVDVEGDGGAKVDVDEDCSKSGVSLLGPLQRPQVAWHCSLIAAP